MTDPNRLVRLVRDAGGAIRTCELSAAGIHRATLARLVAEGRLWRARRGWFVLPGTATPALQAVRVGGSLTCAQALASAGLWSVADGRVHVRVHRTNARLRTSTDSRERRAEHPDHRSVVHWTQASIPTARLIAEPLAALDDYFRCAPRDWALAALDSLVRREPARASELLGRYGVSLREGIDGTCESGLETIFHVRMLRLGLAPRRQVPLDGVGRVDFLFGDRLVVEIDGRGFHDLPEVFESDRARDATLCALGFRSLRFSYQQVTQRWPEVERAMAAALNRGDHH
jgi:very-short-patch-repair endonuclease